MMYSKNEILDFISYFQNEGTIKTFTEGCCYWFAFILENRFPNESVIKYNPVDNHFATAIEDNLYDVTGEIKNVDWDNWYNWDFWQFTDRLDAARVEKNCIKKIYE